MSRTRQNCQKAVNKTNLAPANKECPGKGRCGPASGGWSASFHPASTNNVLSATRWLAETRHRGLGKEKKRLLREVGRIRRWQRQSGRAVALYCTRSSAESQREVPGGWDDVVAGSGRSALAGLTASRNSNVDLPEEMAGTAATNARPQGAGCEVPTCARHPPQPPAAKTFCLQSSL